MPLIHRTFTMMTLVSLCATVPAAAQDQPVDCSLDGAGIIQCAAAGSPRSQLRAGTFIAGSEATGEALAQAIALEVATAPFGSSSGGFTFTFHQDTRAWQRTAGTFGPSFSERALTIGRNRFSGGFNFLRRAYDRFDGYDLDDLELFRFSGGTLSVASSRMSVRTTTDTLAGFAHYGVLDNFDVGVLVPYVRLSVRGTASIYGQQREELQRVALDSSTSGLGDIALFGKYRFWQFGPPPAAGAEPHGGLAAAFTVRLPSGSGENLHGLDSTRTLLSIVGSATVGRASPHVNLGYEFWSRGIEVPRDFQGLAAVTAKDQLHYSAGVEYEAHPRLTVVADAVGRYLRGAGGVGYQDFSFPANVSGVQGAVALVAVPHGLHTMMIAPGVKWNAFRRALISGSLLVAVTEGGLRDRVTPVVGVDWGF